MWSHFLQHFSQCCGMCYFVCGGGRHINDGITEMLYLIMHSACFNDGYVALDTWLRTTEKTRKGLLFQ